jgi:hypothetical protein
LLKGICALTIKGGHSIGTEPDGNNSLIGLAGLQYFQSIFKIQVHSVGMSDGNSADTPRRQHVLHLPMHVRLLLVKDWLTVPEIMNFRVTCRIILQDQVNAFMMKKFQSHGLDKHIFSTKVSARWAANSGIDFRHFNYQPKCVRSNMTPFMDACMDNEVKIVQVLLSSKSISTETLQASIDVNLEDDDGNIALHVAIQENNLEIVEELISYASIDVNNVPLHLAAQLCAAGVAGKGGVGLRGGNKNDVIYNCLVELRQKLSA